MASPAAPAAAAAAAPAAAAPQVQPLAPGHTLLYLANLPFTLNAEQLTAFVQKEAGAQLSGVTIVMRKGKDGPRSRGIGFAQVADANLNAVLALKDKDLDGRPFDVQVAKVQIAGGGERAPRPPRKERAPAQPRAPREPNADGSPAAAPRKRNRRKGKKAAAAAAGADGASAAAAEPREPREPRAPKASKRQSTVPDADHTLLYVNNLSFDATQEDVSALFAGVLGSAPHAVELVLSKYGRFKDRSRGFAFVTVRNEQVQQALTMNGTTFQERELGVQVAKDKTQA